MQCYQIDTAKMGSDDMNAPEALRVCRICLCMEGRMHDMKDYQLKEFYQILTDTECSVVDGLPERVCWECAARLVSFSRLRTKALTSHHILTDMMQRKADLRMKDIKSVNRTHNDLNSDLVQKVLEPISCVMYDGDDVKPVNLYSDDDATPVYLDNDGNDDDAKPVYLYSDDDVTRLNLHSNDNDDDIKPVDLYSDDVTPVYLENDDDVTPVYLKNDDDVTPVYLENDDDVTPVYLENDDDATQVNLHNDDYIDVEVKDKSVETSKEEFPPSTLPEIVDNTNTQSIKAENEEYYYVEYLECDDADDNAVMAAEVSEPVKKKSKVVEQSKQKKQDKVENASKGIEKNLSVMDSKVYLDSAIARHKRARERRQVKAALDASLFDIVPSSHEEQIAVIQKRQERSSYINAYYKCSLCFMGFPNIHQYNVHAARHSDKIHTILKLFKCPPCGKSYKTARDLRSHVDHVHLKKPWPKRVRGPRNKDAKQKTEIDYDD